MIEVTDEMLAAGRAGWVGVGKATGDECMAAAYRAMRALELVPPELRNRQAPPPLKAGDPGMRAEDQARGMNPPIWGAGGIQHGTIIDAPGTSGDYSQGGAGGWKEPVGFQWNWENLTRQQKTAASSRERPSPFISPLEGAAGRMFNDPTMGEMDRQLNCAHRRLDALQSLVLVLASRSEGYPPGDATLQRLIAELENA